jgi:hypothetical protein
VAAAGNGMKATVLADPSGIVTGAGQILATFLLLPAVE